MGAGKTTVGRLLGKALGWRFIDLDEQIEAGEKLQIPEIFRVHGEPYFREIERKYLQQLPSSQPSVVALGGGAFIDSDNRAFIDKTGVTVWLKVSFTKVADRVKIDGTRPKFTDREQAERLFQSREPYYALANVHVATDDGSPRFDRDPNFGSSAKPMNFLFAFFLLLAPVKVETGHFTIYQDGKKIGTEDFSIGQRPGGYLAQGHTQIEVNNERFDLQSRMELNEKLLPTFYELQSKGSVLRMKIGNPLTELEYTADGKTEPQDIRFPADGAIIDDNFFHHYLVLLYRIGLGETTIPTFVPQQLTLGTLTVRPTGRQSFELETSNVKMNATTDSDGRLIRLSVPDAKVVVER